MPEQLLRQAPCIRDAEEQTLYPASHHHTHTAASHNFALMGENPVGISHLSGAKG